MVKKRLADGLGGGADIDEKRGVIRDKPRRRAPDRLFSSAAILRRASYSTFSMPDGKSAPPWMRVSRRWSHKSLRSLADRLRRHGKMLGQIVDQHAAVVLGHLDDFVVSRRQEHERSPLSFLAQSRKNESEYRSRSRLKRILSLTNRVCGQPDTGRSSRRRSP